MTSQHLIRLHGVLAPNLDTTLMLRALHRLGGTLAETNGIADETATA